MAVPARGGELGRARQGVSSAIGGFVRSLIGEHLRLEFVGCGLGLFRVELAAWCEHLNRLRERRPLRGEFRPTRAAIVRVVELRDEGKA